MCESLKVISLLSAVHGLCRICQCHLNVLDQLGLLLLFFLMLLFPERPQQIAPMAKYSPLHGALALSKHGQMAVDWREEAIPVVERRRDARVGGESGKGRLFPAMDFILHEPMANVECHLSSASFCFNLSSLWRSCERTTGFINCSGIC